MHEGHPANGVAPLRRLLGQATQPELVAWLERNPERSQQLSDEEVDELLALQDAEGALTALGVEDVVKGLERRRRLVQQVQVVAGTEYLDLLEKFVTLLHEKVQPARDRS